MNWRDGWGWISSAAQARALGFFHWDGIPVGFFFRERDEKGDYTIENPYYKEWKEQSDPAV